MTDTPEHVCKPSCHNPCLLDDDRKREPMIATWIPEMIRRVNYLLEWMPVCSVGSSGHKRRIAVEQALEKFREDGSLKSAVGVKADLEHPGNDTGGEIAALSGAPSTQREQCDQPCHLAGLVNPSPCRKPKGHDGYCDPAIYVNSGAPSNPPKQIESEDKWYAINRLLEPWRKIWDGDKAQFSAQYPDWIVNAAAELFAHDLCDAWDWNDYVRAAAVIIARHAPLTPTKKSPFQSACRHGVPLTVTCQDCMLATDLPESSTPTPPKEQK